jgi:hypothetical protein
MPEDGGSRSEVRGQKKYLPWQVFQHPASSISELFSPDSPFSDKNIRNFADSKF